MISLFRPSPKQTRRLALPAHAPASPKPAGRPVWPGPLTGTLLAVVLAGCDGSTAVESARASAAATQPYCSNAAGLASGEHLITSWRTAPGDALITHPISQLSVRQAFAPHWDGELLRLRLSNRYSSLPLTLQDVHIAREVTPGEPAMQPDSVCRLSFNGASRVTIPPGESVVSDLMHYPVRAFERLGVSFFAPEATLQITRHLNANEVLYMSWPGNYAADPEGTAFTAVPDGYAANFLAIEALEVAAPRAVTTLVAVGDSITDGSSSTTGARAGSAPPMRSTDQRYPNHLQRLIHTAGLPLSVANAGIGGNELLGSGWLPQFGLGLLERLDKDVLAVTAASHVLAMIGTNDFGNPKTAGPPSPEQMIAGYTELIARVQAAGLRIVLGTLPPAEGAVSEGLLGPTPVGLMHGSAQARQGRDAVNAWIRQQRLSDGIVDFAACLEDPARPGYLAPEYNSGDHLHPSPAGYAAMARCVDLELFRLPASPS